MLFLTNYQHQPNLIKNILKISYLQNFFMTKKFSLNKYHDIFLLFDTHKKGYKI